MNIADFFCIFTLNRFFMIHWSNIFFLIMLIVVCMVIMSKQYDIKPKSKNFVLLFDLFIYFEFGLSCGFLVFHDVFTWWSILFIIICGITISFILLAILNREKRLYDNSYYTPEELIGKKGVIVGKYGNDQWIGELFDDEHTGIVINVTESHKESVEIYDTFKIIKVENGSIYVEDTLIKK